MDLFETGSESFIVKIWTSEDEDGTAVSHWRGQVIHVLSGDHYTFDSLDEIEKFMLPYLRGLGLEVDSDWLRRRRDIP
ncbi:MAG: hypothetical protein KA362_19205 [Chloroflexi bacterium]|nr:hypothetical protein [Chloroflexota bacterium]MBK6709769.1 hypothetical protein [Chloroflexota bacterium]MBK7179905.1 hypothetical protein [Chloroflexota bacterium]MBK7918623.1 hypothetical protein [Chloroflexota bacterium]MBK8932723.1 hypothetical protein [Chloroflexota bacterium]